MIAKLKPFLKKSKSAIVAFKIYDNWRIKRQFQSGNLESLHGSTHSTIIDHIPASLRYIDAQFQDYLTYSGLSLAQLQGARIFELGFGDNVGVALKFLAAGASQAVCLDKFYSRRDLEHQREIYKALRSNLSNQEKRRFDEAINLENGIELNPAKIICVYGTDIENAKEVLSMEPFDLVISRGAVQDIYEPEAAFRAMDSILVDGGYMLHKIDLSDQGMFRDHGMNPLTFLTIPETIYRLMAVHSGRPNRKTMSYYKRVLTELGYDPKLLVTDIIGVGDVGKGNLQPHKEKIQFAVDYHKPTLTLLQEIRPRLVSGFKNLPDEVLIVCGLFIVARKPSRPAVSTAS